MTAPELRVIAKELPDVVGVHGMNKPELLKLIRKARGMEDNRSKKRQNGKSVRELKVKIKELKVKKEAIAGDQNDKMADIIRRRISRLKKKTRKVG